METPPSKELPEGRPPRRQRRSSQERTWHCSHKLISCFILVRTLLTGTSAYTAPFKSPLMSRPSQSARRKQKVYHPAKQTLPIPQLETKLKPSKRTAAVLGMVLTTPESIIEQASTQKLLDVLIDESVRTTARRPIMMQFDPSSGWIWRRWKGTIFSETWISCARNTSYALIILYLYSNFPRIQQHLTGFNTLWAQLLSVTTLTITFFVNQSYALWRKCYELSRRLQGRLHDIDMTLAMHAARKTPASPSEPSTYTSASRQLLDLVSRHVRLFNLLTYASFTRSHRPILTPRGMRRLVERGLMTSGELEVLVNAEIPATQRHNSILMWITRIFVEGRQAGHFQGGSGFEQQFMEKIHVIRSQYGAIGDELQGRMPLAYAHIVQVLVDCVLMMYPLMAFSSGMSPMLGVLGTGLLTISYQGLFDLAKQFLDPYDNENYGRGEDPLCVDTLIAETNAGSVRWMYGFEQFPVSSQRIVDGELFDYMLPVRGYSVGELEKMEEEKLQKERELKGLREREEADRREAERLKEVEMEASQEAEEQIKAPEEGVGSDEATLHGSILGQMDDEDEVEGRAAGANAIIGASDQEAASSMEDLEIGWPTTTATISDPSSADTSEESIITDRAEEGDECVHRVTFLESGLPVSFSSPNANQIDSKSIRTPSGKEDLQKMVTCQQPQNPTSCDVEISAHEIIGPNLTATAKLKVEGFSVNQGKNEQEIHVNDMTREFLQAKEGADLQNHSTSHNNAYDQEAKVDMFVMDSVTESCTNEFEDFESFRELPWYEEVGPDGQEVRLSQMLAEEEWEEEKAYEFEKAGLSSPLTLEDFEKQRNQFVEAAENELLETELVMMASPGSELRSIDSSDRDRSSPRPTYDQTKLSGVAQLWGLPPDEDIAKRVPQPTEAHEEGGFNHIGMLWGRAPEPASSGETATFLSSESSFKNINELWDDSQGDSDIEKTKATCTQAEPVSADDSDHFEIDDNKVDFSPYQGLEWHQENSSDRLSQMLADEDWDYDEEPDEQIRTLEDYTKKVVEILEAAEDEILETEAILRAPPAAESVTVFEREDGEEPQLHALNETRPSKLLEDKEEDIDLDALEMDVNPLEALSSRTTELVEEDRAIGNSSSASVGPTSAYLENISSGWDYCAGVDGNVDVSEEHPNDYS